MLVPKFLLFVEKETSLLVGTVGQGEKGACLFNHVSWMEVLSVFMKSLESTLGKFSFSGDH